MAGFGEGNFGIGTYGNGGYIVTASPDDALCGDSGNSLNAMLVGNSVEIQPVLDVSLATFKGFLLCTSSDGIRPSDTSATIGGWSIIPG